MTKAGTKTTVKETKESFSFLSLMQNIGKSLVFPIATLPAAALLLRIGVFIQSFGAVDGSGGEQFAYWLGFIMSTPGSAVFDNMPIIFGIGVAFGFAKENRGEVALVGAIAYFALIGLAQNEGSLSSLVYGHANIGNTSFAVHMKITSQADYNTWAGTASSVAGKTNGDILGGLLGGSWNTLDLAKENLQTAQGNFSSAITGATLTPTLDHSGVLYLNIFNNDGALLTTTWLMNFGVFGGIMTGLTTAVIYNKFSDVRLHQALGFFSGRRFVPIVTLFIMIGVAAGMAIVWPWVNIALVETSILIAKVPFIGAGLYGFANRLLIPFGLHQVLNTYFWFQAPVVSGKDIVMLYDSAAMQWNPVLGDINAFADIKNESFWQIGSTVYQLTFDAVGTHAHFYEVTDFRLPTQAIDSATDHLDLLRGTHIGMYQAGFFPTMMFGLPAVAIAMAIKADDEWKKQVWAFMIAGSVVAFLTGITEPLEFSFMFISPVIYLVYSALTGVWASLVVLLHISNGFGFSAGFIDWLISFLGGGTAVLSGAGIWSNLELLIIGVIAGVVNFFAVYFLIGALNIATPGRNGNTTGLSNEDDSESDKPAAKGQASAKLTKMAEGTIDFIGVENIKKIDNCITRVRLTVTDNSVYNDDDAKKIGYTGVIKVGKQAYQMIIGPESEVIANEMRRLISEGYGATPKKSPAKGTTTKK